MRVHVPSLSVMERVRHTNALVAAGIRGDVRRADLAVRLTIQLFLLGGGSGVLIGNRRLAVGIKPKRRAVFLTFRSITSPQKIIIIIIIQLRKIP